MHAEAIIAGCIAIRIAAGAPRDMTSRLDVSMVSRAQRLIGQLRTGDWLHHDRVVGWGIVLLIEIAVLMLFLVLWSHGIVMHLEHATSIDFISFYAAGDLTNAGTPGLAYNHAAHFLAEQRLGLADAPYQFFFYPPVYLLVCAALARLPYYVAYTVFEAVTLGLFALVMRAVLRERGWGWLAPLLAFPPVWWTIGQGQNAFLTAALFGLFALRIDARPVSAGMLLGAICYKPHFGVLTPIALLAGRRWGALLGASAMVAGLVGLSVLVFGVDTWLAYLHALSGMGDAYDTGRVSLAGYVTLFGAARLIGWSPAACYALQGASAVLMAVLVGVVWARRATSQAQRVAILLVATLLAVPLALIYDQMLALLAIGWLLREARESGYLPWEKLMLMTVYPVSLVSVFVATARHLPVGPLVSFIVLIACLRRVWHAPARVE